ncbi:MAG TPA: hypothetical protein VH599_11835 [Ktedonobacterales bacterium]
MAVFVAPPSWRLAIRQGACSPSRPAYRRASVAPARRLAVQAG